jgi:uncharacterized glyoxalase superfamily protein PhnB
MAAQIYPVLHYRDLENAIAQMGEAFGATEHMVHRDPDGGVAYAELELEGCIFGVGASAGDGGPFDLGPTARYIAIEDPDAMHERVAGAGLEIVMPLMDQDYGSREFACRDLEENVWCFGTYRPGA